MMLIAPQSPPEPSSCLHRLGTCWYLEGCTNLGSAHSLAHSCARPSQEARVQGSPGDDHHKYVRILCIAIMHIRTSLYKHFVAIAYDIECDDTLTAQYAWQNTAYFSLG